MNLSIFNIKRAEMKALLIKHKRVVMTTGIVIVCVFLAGVRWFSSYSSSSRSTGDKDQRAQGSETPVVASYLCKKVNFTDELVLTGTIQGGARVEFRFNRDGRVQKLNYHVGENVKSGWARSEAELSRRRKR
jgi:multidrug efflux pump subunit AcrA (membrane-fusion protein)